MPMQRGISEKFDGYLEAIVRERDPEKGQWMRKDRVIGHFFFKFDTAVVNCETALEQTIEELTLSLQQLRKANQQ
jgi:hypothetical protein